MNDVVPLLIWIGAAAFEGMCAGRDPMGQLKATRQPSWPPPNWVWVLIGIAWYGICFTGLARLLPYWPGHKLPVILLCAMMLVNAAANIPQFRMKRLDLAFLVLFPIGPCSRRSSGRSSRWTASRSAFSPLIPSISFMRRHGDISS